jgi:aspartokinase
MSKQVQETVFEKQRGVSRIEVRTGFAQAHIEALAEPVSKHRLAVLEEIARAGISLDFLKLTQNGLSFLVREELSGILEAALRDRQVQFSVKPGHRIVLVHAVNMRDEEGLIARIVHESIASGVKVEHIGDMHDRMLMVVDGPDADRLEAHLSASLLEVHGGR